MALKTLLLLSVIACSLVNLISGESNVPNDKDMSPFDAQPLAEKDAIPEAEKRNYQHIWRDVADRMNPAGMRLLAGYDGEGNAMGMQKRNYQYIWRNVAQRMPLHYYSSDVDQLEGPIKRNYQHIWRNVAQKMPQYVSDSDTPVKRNYQYIWRNIAEKMPKSRMLRSISVFS